MIYPSFNKTDGYTFYLEQDALLNVNVRSFMMHDSERSIGISQQANRNGSGFNNDINCSDRKSVHTSLFVPSD